ncbi:hypothetical protein [Methylobacterium sp. AMS5]|uniref:hypothetical protein n=1 Tax=Methylobacterium sp. AMS5 TaxID=925818 RepID=UPI00074F91A9|nr:hypothetical protein [Methylobacterium sp. AMS5]AMB47677.1 hypothetical protein Y590_22250 [Methylobacterium sp. AMS5]
MSKNNIVAKIPAPLTKEVIHPDAHGETVAVPQVEPADRTLSGRDSDAAIQTLLVTIGRGKSGKSLMSKLLIECARAANLPLRATDADPTNSGLKDTHADTVPVADADPQTVYDHTRAEIERLLAGNASTLLDFGAGNPTITTLLRELNLARLLKRRGKRLTLFCLLGPERGDLSQIATFLSQPNLEDARIVLCWNEGLVPRGREMSDFDLYVTAKPVVEALDRGARLVRLPRLAPATRIDDLGLTFRDAALGRANAAGQRLGGLDTQITAEWLMRLPESFAPIADWLRFAPVESLLQDLEA